MVNKSMYMEGQSKRKRGVGMRGGGDAREIMGEPHPTTKKNASNLSESRGWSLRMRDKYDGTRAV